MEKDIVPKLLETIEKEFDEKTFNSEVLKKALKALQNNKATYEDANEFAIEVGEILSEVLTKNITVKILPDGKMYYNIADRILNPTMSKNYSLISDFAADIQTELNHQAGLGIKGQKARLNQSRIDGIIERLVAADNFDDIKWILGEPMETWKATISSMLQFTKDDEGGSPKLGQFTTPSMSPFTEQLRTAAAGFAGETGLTLDDLGFVSDNPSSVEAIKASHENLRLAGRKAQRSLGSGFLNVGYLSACLRDNFPYLRSQFYETKVKWEPLFEADASSLTLVGDGAVKINQAIPNYITGETIRDLTGIKGGE